MPRFLSLPSPRFLLAGLIGLAPSMLVAEPTKPKAPAPPPPAAAAPVMARITFTDYTLPNGLRVILHQDRTLPVVASYVLYHVGSKDERSDRTGFAHFFEHLMFEGAENIARGQIDKLVSGAGGNLNASTSFDQTDYYLNLPSNQLRLALWIESERMLHAKVEETGVETQRQVVKEERRLRVDNQPYGALFEELAKAVFRGSSYEWTPIGSAQYIDQATIDEFRDFYRQHYLPNNAILCLAGDFDVAETKKLIEEYFGPIPKGELPPRPEAKLPPQTEARSVEVKKQSTPLPASLHAWRAPRQTDDDSYAAEMLTDILADGKSSRLYRRMVDGEQAAVQAQAFSFPLEKAGLMGVFAVGNRGVTLDKLDALISDEVGKVIRDGVTEEELQKARNAKETQLAASYGTMAARARALARYAMFFGDPDRINTELERYARVTRADIQKTAKRYLTAEGQNVLHFPVPEPAAAAKGNP